MRDPLDTKLIAAWGEIDAMLQADIRAALKKPGHLGATIRAPEITRRNIKTSMGYVVTCGFVTPLAREMIEAIEFNEAAA